jgi:proline dehydrogenase
MLRRIDTIVRYAKDRDVRVMIDAEQSYFQAAVNRLCMEMMRTYNREKAYVFNTYQCYLKDAFNIITTDLALAKREDFFFGAKLVRGAYMDQERLRAATLGYEDPICRSFEATTEMFQSVLSEVLRQINEREKGKIAVMIASHNEDTVRYTLERMKDFRVKASDRLICFGQLYGMCDPISFSLGQAGYSVYKYMPYGPVEEVLPYLSRRAAENKGILAKVKKEKRLLRTELVHRAVTFNWFYKPPVPVMNGTMNGQATAATNNK